MRRIAKNECKIRTSAPIRPCSIVTTNAMGNTPLPLLSDRPRGSRTAIKNSTPDPQLASVVYRAVGLLISQSDMPLPALHSSHNQMDSSGKTQAPNRGRSADTRDLPSRSVAGFLAGFDSIRAFGHRQVVYGFDESWPGAFDQRPHLGLIRSRIEFVPRIMRSRGPAPDATRLMGSLLTFRGSAERNFMKYAGLVLLPAGFILTLTALVLFPAGAARSAFAGSGVAVEALGLGFAVRGHLLRREESRP